VPGDPAVEDGGMGVISGDFAFKSKDTRFRRLFTEAANRPPGQVPRITTIRSVSLSRRRTESTVGLTRYSGLRFSFGSRPRQTITFYSSLADSLSDSALLAVIAHELAHAWLNEHVHPEESIEREHEADSLAREWGFGPELDALDREADTVNS
jgi:SprT-like family